MRGGKREGAGRKPGTPNKITMQLREAILEAAHQAGGRDGMVGYLKKQATHNSASFMALLGKILPHQIAGDTALAAARKALELLSIGLIAAGLKRPD